MSDIDTLLAHLSLSFTSRTEDVAVRALGYVFTKYAASREGLDDVVRSGARDIAPVAKVSPQVSAPDGTRPDLVGTDEAGAERVLIEVKFWAGLTPRQPHAYLDRLPDDGPTALLFVVPEERVPSLWPQLRTRSEEAGHSLAPVDAERQCVRVDGTERHMLVAGWTGLLDRMAACTRDDADAQADIRQLRSLTAFAEEDRFRPVLPTGADLGPDSRHLRDLARLVDTATERAVSEGWASRKGLNRTPRPYGYGRYIRLADHVYWLGVNVERWERDGETPLWLHDYDPDAWFPLPLPVGDAAVEEAEVLDGVLSALRVHTRGASDGAR